MKLLRNINKFYRRYNVKNIESITLTKSDMHDSKTLEYTKSCIWHSMQHFSDDTQIYQWLYNLYNDLGDYMSKPKCRISTIVTLIALVLGILGIGMFAAVAIEYGIDLTVGVGITLSAILAVCSGIATYENIKEDN